MQSLRSPSTWRYGKAPVVVFGDWPWAGTLSARRKIWFRSISDIYLLRSSTSIRALPTGSVGNVVYSSQLLDWHLRDNLLAWSTVGERNPSRRNEQTVDTPGQLTGRLDNRREKKEREIRRERKDDSRLAPLVQTRSPQLSRLPPYFHTIAKPNERSPLFPTGRRTTHTGRSPSLGFLSPSRTFPRWITMYGAIDQPHLSLWRLFYGSDNEPTRVEEVVRG
ncbi:hypothetical protein K0M31_017836 [Melipona bicolor]|uniref:Uncharacterized protein n=1 Tax=Melipona bicolor TaxID=60889 RepID=A0AA40KSW0_9HYME|nr:hypothetical protein K0M31_017836 [Melipona bicolor]